MRSPWPPAQDPTSPFVGVMVTTTAILTPMLPFHEGSTNVQEDWA